LFGGQVTGRNVELVEDRRLVQAWRAATWPEGAYSIVNFQLDDAGDSATKLVFDHTGFPEDARDELEPGWVKMYWEPLKQYLA
jgi:activator of HSP90 ATPase